MSKEIIVQTSTPERLFVKVYRDFLNSKMLSGKEQIVFIQLKQYISIGNDNGAVNPTLTTLAENVKMTEKTVREILKKLQKIGVLEIKRQGLNKPNIYTIKDSAEIWGAQVEERQTEVENIEIQQKIADLRSLGYIIKEPNTKTNYASKSRTRKSKNKFNNFEKSDTKIDDEFEKKIISN